MGDHDVTVTMHGEKDAIILASEQVRKLAINAMGYRCEVGTPFIKGRNFHTDYHVSLRIYGINDDWTGNHVKGIVTNIMSGIAGIRYD